MNGEDEKLREGDAGTTTTTTVEKDGANEKGAEEGRQPKDGDEASKDKATGSRPGAGNDE